MNWFTSLFKKSEPEVQFEHPKEDVVVNLAKYPLRTDYPKSLYKVYWEVQTILKPDGKWEGVLRFYEYAGTMVNHFFFYGETEHEVKEKAFRIVRTDMENYKR
jgi:hypothetical protein